MVADKIKLIFKVIAVAIGFIGTMLGLAVTAATTSQTWVVVSIIVTMFADIIVFASAFLYLELEKNYIKRTKEKNG